MFERIFSQKPMIADQVRMEAYRKAIHEVVKKGDVVADIGTGSGILAFFALQAGARKVYAIEQRKIIEEAEELAKLDGMEERIVFIKGRSDRIELPEKVDVITSEILGHFGYEEHVTRFKIDARKRFLKSEGRLVPAWLELYLFPVTSESIWNDHIGFWREDCYGFDFSAIRDAASSQIYATDCSAKATQLAPPSKISHVNFYEVEKVPFLFQGKSVIQKRGPFHGWAGYFQSGLSPSVVLSTSPERPKTHWMQTFFPMKDVIMLEEGDEVLCMIKALPLLNRMFWEWGTRINRDGMEIAAFNQSDLQITKEVLVVGNPSFRPVLTQKGEVSRKVLHLCDGRKTVGEISELMRAEYPERYGSLGDAVQEVVGVIRRMVRIE